MYRETGLHCLECSALILPRSKSDKLYTGFLGHSRCVHILIAPYFAFFEGKERRALLPGWLCGMGKGGAWEAQQKYYLLIWVWRTKLHVWKNWESFIFLYQYLANVSWFDYPHFLNKADLSQAAHWEAHDRGHLIFFFLVVMVTSGLFSISVALFITFCQHSFRLYWQ